MNDIFGVFLIEFDITSPLNIILELFSSSKKAKVNYN